MSAQTVVIKSRHGTFYLEPDGAWWRRPVGQDKLGGPWQRKRVTVFQQEVAGLLMAGVRRGDLPGAEAEVDGLAAKKRRATARRVIAGKNKGRAMSEEQKAKLSEIASKRVGDANPFYGRTHTEETKARLSAAATGRTGWRHSEETKEKIGAAQRCVPRKSPDKAVREKMSRSHAASFLKRERGYPALLTASKFPGGIVGCRGILEEAAVRVIQADGAITEAGYEDRLIPYVDAEGVNRHCVPDYSLMLDGKIIVVEAGYWNRGSKTKRKARELALRSYCETNGLELRFWSAAFLMRRCEELGIPGIVGDLAESRILLS